MADWQRSDDDGRDLGGGKAGGGRGRERGGGVPIYFRGELMFAALNLTDGSGGSRSDSDTRSAVGPSGGRRWLTPVGWRGVACGLGWLGGWTGDYGVVEYRRALIFISWLG